METDSRIPQKLFFRIGEVCDLIKVQPHVLRYWETEFPMLAPQKNRAGQRVYRRKDVEMVVRIHNLLYEEKFTIAGARKRILEETKKGTAPRLKTSLREKAIEVERADIKAVFDEMDEDFADFEDSFAPEAVNEPIQKSEAEKPAMEVVTATQSTKEKISTASTNHPAASPETQRRLRFIKHNLEELLTLLKSDASINRSA